MKHNFKLYCKDYKNIENYEAAKKDNFVGWCCHHRLQTWTSEGERRAVDITAEELQALGMYYGRPASELIFMKKSEHTQLHQKGKTHPHSLETRKKMSEAQKGKKIWNKGKTLSDEHKKKISEATKGENNPFYGKHHSAESKKKMSESQKGKHIGNTATKGMHWYNNGKISKIAFECPTGFVPGRIKKA